MTAQEPTPKTRVSYRLAYDRGKAARESGKAHTANPYAVGTWQREAWLQGWGKQPSPMLDRT